MPDQASEVFQRVIAGLPTAFKVVDVNVDDGAITIRLNGLENTIHLPMGVLAAEVDALQRGDEETRYPILGGRPIAEGLTNWILYAIEESFLKTPNLGRVWKYHDWTVEPVTPEGT